MVENALKQLGKWVVTHKWRVISFWLILLTFGGYYGSQIGEHLTGGGWGVPGSDSNLASERLSEEFESRDETSLTLVINHETEQVGSDVYTEAIEQAPCHYNAKQRLIVSIHGSMPQIIYKINSFQATVIQALALLK
ncbi:hypothetical protein [Geomicrobium sp. JCM 19055]|uniref:hypothetical protein n=1 Tax=Geomicrobium sp. JCM 19055 TaxID=1460649 RepID=UPI00045EDE43|nr:hypothetical protein [Geomicrobium sp. JCM 19055]GAJ98429.1 hypothetical protein JCM19055_1356 [Geomicrobium sp. JCM 19055]